MPEEMTLLFVYGTLKHGDVRAPLLDGQRFGGQASTAPLYKLYNTGEYPALVEASPLGIAGLAIHGELWGVDAMCLARLDEEEGVDEGLYARRIVELAGEPRQAHGYLYLLPTDGMQDCGDCWC